MPRTNRRQGRAVGTGGGLQGLGQTRLVTAAEKEAGHAVDLRDHLRIAVIADLIQVDGDPLRISRTISLQQLGIELAIGFGVGGVGRTGIGVVTFRDRRSGNNADPRLAIAASQLNQALIDRRVVIFKAAANQYQRAGAVAGNG